MAQGVNRVTLIGNLGQDPKETSSANVKACNLSIATTLSWKDKTTGMKNEQTEWHSVVCFGSFAAIAKEYLQKGSKIYVEGYLKTNKWTDKKGQDRATKEIICTYLQMLDNARSKKEHDADEHQDSIKLTENINNKINENIDDDIPF